ncbi:MAG: response regulator [Betaproteobacteria bacterium]
MADILVVDDEIGIRELLSEILGDEGHEVLQAENAAQARSARQKARPDLVLLDIWMPDTDGTAVLREWSESGLLDMPVIMMSGHATVEMASQATRLGAVGFLEKPIALQKLLAAVQSALHGKSAILSTTRPQQTASIQAGPAAVPAMPRAELKSEPSAFNTPHSQPQTGFGETTARDTQSELQQSIAHQGLQSPLSGPQARRDLDSAGGMLPASPWAVSLHLDRDHSSPSARLSQLSFDQPLRDARDAFERLYFEHHLAREGGSMTRVAERTGLERTHLYRKLKQLGVELGRSTRREV